VVAIGKALGHHGGMRFPLPAPLALIVVVCASLAVSSAAPAQSDCIVLEDFAGSAVNGFPAGWQVVKDEGKPVYSVLAEDGTRFLRASTRGLGIQAAKEREWDLAQYPVLTWKWRPREFPEGANEQTGKNDSALAVYAVFPYTRVGVKLVKSVKYIWSEKVPAETHLTGSGGRTQVRVLRTGVPADRNAWVEERVNVAEDYKRFFKEDLRKPAGVAVLTDADDTASQAEGDYADFRACRS
jgi:Protein of unknown function (DUF3047)